MARRLLVLLLLLSIAAPAGAAPTPSPFPSPSPAPDAPEPRRGTAYAVPLYGTFLRGWDAPEDNPYAPGHRGVDVAVGFGTPVHASRDGVVSFAGSVAGNLSVTVDDADGVRSTCSFLSTIAVRAGQPVARGQVLGRTGAGHANSGLPPHVHLSARRNAVYFDPMVLWVGDDYSDLLLLVG